MFYFDYADEGVEIITQEREYMKPKLHPIYIIVGLFLFKVGIVDNMRNIGHHHPDRYVASSAEASALRPIR